MSDAVSDANGDSMSNDMIGFAETVLAYTDGLDQDSFVQSRLNDDATLRNLELIGEAASHVPEDGRELAPAIPWRQSWRHVTD